MTEQDEELTFGEKAVGLTFNPSGDPHVHACKAAYAAEIDRMNDLRNRSTGEKARLAAIAIGHLQTAQMWSVKAITWRN